MGKVLGQQQGELFFITLNRADKQNAFDREMIEEITSLFQSVESQSPTAKAIVLKAEGRNFCAGADLKYMRSMAQFSAAENQADAGRLFSMFEAVLNCQLPVVARVHGHVLGGGLGLVAACDIVAAESSAIFGFSEVQMGLVPAVISPFIFRKVHRARAQEWMLTGRRFTALEALNGGLIHRVGTSSEVEQYLAETTNQFLTAGPSALRATKNLLRRVPELNWAQLKEETSRVIAKQRVSGEGQEGLKAFFEKRSPAWRSSP